METGSERRKSTDAQRAAFAAAKAEPTAHKPRLITSHHAREQVHGAGAIGRFNNALAVAITKSVGTMWAAYLFTVLALCSLPAVLSSTGWIPAGFFPSWLIAASLISLVAWVAQTFLQLVLLPIIIVGQNVISSAQDARAEADHLTLTALHTINVQQLQMLQQQKEMLQQQAAILALLQAKGITPPTPAS